MVRRIYDRVAERYDNDWSDIYTNSRDRCIKQIVTHFGQDRRKIDAVDFAVGTGNAFNELSSHFQFGACKGFDISAGMLSIAKSKLTQPVELIRQDARRVKELVPADSVDLTMSHFLLNFIEADHLFDTAFKLLRPGGVFSLITSTQQSMSELYSGRFEKPARMLGVQRAIQKMSTPGNHQQCLESLKNHGFEIIEDNLLRQQVSFDSFNDVKSWAVDSGWMVSSLDKNLGLRVMLGRALIKLYELAMHPLYPVKASTEISIVLARKPESRIALDSAA